MTKKKQKENFNTDLAWAKLHARFEDDNLLETKETKRFDFQKLLKIAAILLVPLMLTALYYYFPTKHSKQLLVETSSAIEIKEVKLPDGSLVYLSSSSKLFYPKEFGKNTREIEFEGEAFFDIAKNADKPFIINAGKAEIKVLGTSFNINTKFTKDKLEVSVATGKVKVSKLDDKESNVFLKPGEMAYFDNSEISKKENRNKNYLSWKTKHFDFRNVEMRQVISDLNKVYGVHIVIEKELILKRKLRTKFENKPLDSILKIISEPYNLKIKKDGKSIILY